MKNQSGFGLPLFILAVGVIVVIFMITTKPIVREYSINYGKSMEFTQ